jgi:hypothetical protein
MVKVLQELISAHYQREQSKYSDFKNVELLPPERQIRKPILTGFLF